jgi:uncharacterized protein (UPF0332 family)
LIPPSDFLNHAKRLTDPKNSPKEVDWRSAISRAYYSLYHETIVVLKNKRYNIPRKDTHKFVSLTLYGLDRNVGRKYKAFRDDRNQADYKLALTSFTQTSSQTKVIEIERFIQRIKNLT